MKKRGFGLLQLLLIICLIGIMGAVYAFAGTATGTTIPATRGFTVRANGYAAVTKGTLTVDVANVAAIRNLCSADCTYTLNGTGPAWLLKANAPETIYVPPNVKSIVFSVTSSASPGTKIYNQTQ